MKWDCKGRRLWKNMPSFWSHTEVTRIQLVAVTSSGQHSQYITDKQVIIGVTEAYVCVGQNVRPLNKREYILDIATEAEPVDTNYSLWFRRVIWSLALKLDNELYVTMHYNQVGPAV